MRNHLSRNKAITFDGFTEEWFINTVRLDLVSNLWNRECLILMPWLGEARLIPLNKEYPNIP